MFLDSNFYFNQHGKKVCKVVLTGGPCAGKTTAMNEVANRIKQSYNEDWQVFTVAEASSLLYTGRVQRSTMNDKQIYQWQKDVLKTILQLESVYDNIANEETKRHTMIICDRGGVDPKAYTLGDESWSNILKELETNEGELMQRYHVVIQLHTAPKEFYSTENNPYRRENYQEAAQINKKYQGLWENHKAFNQVHNFNVHNQIDGWIIKSNQVFDIIKDVLES